MKFYTQTHKHYCGIDLHARTLYVCILDQEGTVLVHKNIPAHPDTLLRLITPYRDDLVIGVECMFSWYWVADLCSCAAACSHKPTSTRARCVAPVI